MIFRFHGGHPADGCLPVSHPSGVQFAFAEAPAGRGRAGTCCVPKPTARSSGEGGGREGGGRREEGGGGEAGRLGGWRETSMRPVRLQPSRPPVTVARLWARERWAWGPTAGVGSPPPPTTLLLHAARSPVGVRCLPTAACFLDSTITRPLCVPGVRLCGASHRQDRRMRPPPPSIWNIQ